MKPMGKTDFKKRVKRIQSSSNTSYYDPDLEMHIPKHVSNEAIRRIAKGRKTSLSGFLSSAIIGAFCLMIAQVVRYRYFGMSEMTNATLATDLMLAVLFTLTLSAMLRYRRYTYRFAQIMGAGAMFVAGHNLMWYYPEQLALIYTTSYVEQVRATTEPLSIVWRDTTFSL